MGSRGLLNFYLLLHYFLNFKITRTFLVEYDVMQRQKMFKYCKALNALTRLRRSQKLLTYYEMGARRVCQFMRAIRKITAVLPSSAHHLASSYGRPSCSIKETDQSVSWVHLHSSGAPGSWITPAVYWGLNTPSFSLMTRLNQLLLISSVSPPENHLSTLSYPLTPTPSSNVKILLLLGCKILHYFIYFFIP